MAHSLRQLVEVEPVAVRTTVSQSTTRMVVALIAFFVAVHRAVEVAARGSNAAVTPNRARDGQPVLPAGTR